MYQAMKGVQALHSHGMVHMDLKLDNVMVNCNLPPLWGGATLSPVFSEKGQWVILSREGLLQSPRRHEELEGGPVLQVGWDRARF